MSEMLLYRIGEWTRGWNVLECMDKLERLEHAAPSNIKGFQDNLVRTLVRHAYVNVPLYRDLWASANVDSIDKTGVSGINELPMVTKTMLMDAGDGALDRTVPKRRLIMGRSSGSTGKRFVYYMSKNHQSWRIAAKLLGWKWAGWTPGERWVRLQFRGPLSLRQRVDDWAFKCLNMGIDKFDDEFMRSFMERAVRFRPTMLRGYSGGTYVFAKWLLENNDDRLRPKTIVLIGDTLYPHYRDAIERAFRAPIFDTYGGEGITAAIQCRYGTYHIPPITHVDLVPEGPSMPDGQPHRLILTSLTNSAMPIIRYDIGDLAIPANTPCPCGRAWPGLKRIIGRDSDIVRTVAGRHLVVHHFGNVLREIDGVDEYQVRQVTPDTINLCLVTNDAYDPARDESAINTKLAALAGVGTSFVIDYVDSIPLPSSGKRRYIISSIQESRVYAPEAKHQK